MSAPFARTAQTAARRRWVFAMAILFGRTIATAPESMASSCASRGDTRFDFNESPERLTSPLVRTNGELRPVSWGQAIAEVAKRFASLKARNGKFGVIGSNHTTNEENYLLQKFARQVLRTSNIDHHRTGDVASLIDALPAGTNHLATTADLYNRKAALIIGSDLAQEQPFLAFQLRANWRHHKAHVYAVTPGPVREDNYATTARAEPGQEFEVLESMRERLAAEPELVILFGDAIKGEAVRRLVAFGNSLNIPVSYVCLLDYSNSRGASDMGLLPDLLPGYRSVAEAGLEPGLNYDQILSATGSRCAVGRRRESARRVNRSLPRTRLLLSRISSLPKRHSAPMWCCRRLRLMKRTAR